MTTRAKPWKFRGWIVTPGRNIFGTCWKIEPDPDGPKADPSARTCSRMEIPTGSYRYRSNARDAIRRDHEQTLEHATRRAEREERDR